MKTMTSLERVLCTLGHREPDRVPFFLLLTMHGAKELGLGIQEYFSRPEYVAEGQLRMRARYRHDCLYAFFYAALELAAWGGEVAFSEDGPPNAAAPLVTELERVLDLAPPRIADAAPLHKALSAITMMKEKAGDEVPIIGVVMSPFSVPVMQLGFERYLELIYGDPRLFGHLMAVNSEFCVNWANAQLEAGATAICYFDPVSSPTIVPRELYLKTGFRVAASTLARIKGPTATHMASGRCLGITDDIAATGTAAVGVSVLEDLAVVKDACRGKLSVIGNLNGIEMRSWSPETAAAKVREAMAQAAAGGGFILSDSHGEIPWQVTDEVLTAISDTVHSFGSYPLSPGNP